MRSHAVRSFTHKGYRTSVARQASSLVPRDTARHRHIALSALSVLFDCWVDHRRVERLRRHALHNPPRIARQPAQCHTNVVSARSPKVRPPVQG